ncbi:MAG: rhamnulokinase family protein [Candidatus Coatesbacteria bacterium]
MAPTFLAVDLGASSGRVIAGTWDGARFALRDVHRFANGPVQGPSGLYTDIDMLWREVRTGLRRFTEQSGENPAGVGVDTWGVDFGLLGRDGTLLAHPVHYRDTRTNGIMEKVFAVVPRDEVFRVTGIQFMQINTLYQLYSLVEAGSGHLRDASALLMTPDLFHYWLSGRQVAEYSIASTSQMLDANARTWSAPMLGRLGIPAAILPPVVMPGTVLGPALDGVAAEAGWTMPVPVIAVGSHDTASAVAAVPDLDGSSAYLSSGTWSLMGIETAAPVITPASLALNFTNEGGVAGTIRLLKNIMGLWLVQECQRVWERDGRKYGWEELAKLAEGAPAFRSIVDPDAAEFFSPGDMPEAIRAFCRRTGQPGPDSVGAVVRCALESLALKYRLVLGDLETLAGRRLEVIRVVGGGSQNRLLNRFTADACGRPVVAGPVEATALGNVMLQAVATGRLGSVAEGRRAIAASVTRETVEPGRGGAWDEVFLGRFAGLCGRG